MNALTLVARKLTNSMEKSFWDADRGSAGQQFKILVMKPKVRCKGSSLDPILIQANRLHIFNFLFLSNPP
jgi:hypothetical protein